MNHGDEYIPDPSERGEMRAERWENRIEGDFYICSCGKKCVIYDAECLSPDPWGEPFCPDCVESFLKERGR